MDDNFHSYLPTNKVGEPSTNVQQTNVQQVLKERLADLEQLLKANPILPIAKAGSVDPCDVRVSVAAHQG